MRMGTKGFRRWLETRHDGEIVGVTATSWSCPVAHYVQSTTDADRVGAYPDTLVLEGADDIEYRELPMPQLFEHFIDAIDDGKPLCSSVTKEQALATLDEVIANYEKEHGA